MIIKVEKLKAGPIVPPANRVVEVRANPISNNASDQNGLRAEKGTALRG